MTRGACCFSAVLVAIAAWTNRVQAAPGGAARLEYARSERAAACPDRGALKAAVSKRLGYDPFLPAARQTIVVEIIDVDGGLRAQMRLSDENGLIIGSRELREQAGHCDELVASLALAISIALDPGAALAEKSPNPGREPAAAADPPPEPERESVEQEHPPKVNRPRAERTASAAPALGRLEAGVRSTLFADAGSAPALAFGWRLGLDLRRNWLQVGAEFTQQFPSTKELAEGGRARVSLLGGMLAPCVVSHTLAGCALLTLGVLQTRGENIPYPSSQNTFYAALGARFEFTPTLLGQLQLLTQVEALKPFTPVSLEVVGGEVWHTPFLTFSAGIGLRLHFL